MTPSYALVFKTHAWDDFISRQFKRYVSACRSGTIAIVVDETNGSVGEVEHDLVIRTTNSEILSLGLADAFGKGGLLWWNTDYPNYLAFTKLPRHDYYVFVEYDTCANLDLDELIKAVQVQSVDLLTQPTRQDLDSWYWTKFHEAVYDRKEIRGSLNCFSVFSHRAMELLLERRVEAAKQFNSRAISFWPGNEVFVPTEIERAGFKMASLEDYGDATHYEWHPPILEDDIPQTPKAFLHPVLDKKRFIASVLKYEFDLSSYFSSRSPLRRTLSRFPLRDYVPQMPSAFRQQVIVKIRQALGSI